MSQCCGKVCCRSLLFVSSLFLLNMPVLKDNTQLGVYTVQNLIKSNLYTETYRAVDRDEHPFFLKLFLLNRVPSKLINEKTGILKEIEYCQLLHHRNIVSFIDQGELDNEEGHFQYYLTNYFNGQILSDFVSQNGILPEEESLKIFRGILNGLSHLHSMVPPLCHNDLDPSNIILLETDKSTPEIIDLGHLSERCSGLASFDTSDIDILYHANENMVSIFDEQGDIFSVCAILYYMLTGEAPWQVELPDEMPFKEKFFELTQYRKKNPLDLDNLNVSGKVKAILTKGLELKYTDRFQSIEQIIQILDGSEPVKNSIDSCKKTDGIDSSREQQSPNQTNFEIKRGKGNGFKDIAGMRELKSLLEQKVIFVIQNKELAEEYQLTPPNGMLLYGPPGCGKTFFAEKFAEETGFNFMLIKSSDLASSYVHGSQQKIAQLFQQAAQHAPIVLCFDEFDALVPDRSMHGSEYVSSEVNEFLSQMNNCSERGIFIVATSNRPDKIDPAVLRTGRIDKLIYVPLPDFDARKEMLQLYLNKRPSDGDIDFDVLAEMTEGYIASDIAYVVNDSAMTAAYNRAKISEELLKTVINHTRPSIRKDSLKVYDEIKDKMDASGRRNLTDRPPIGYVK